VTRPTTGPAVDRTHLRGHPEAPLPPTSPCHRPNGTWDVRRFRPNVLIDLEGDGWVEDSWFGCQIQIGAVTLIPTQPCIRWGASLRGSHRPFLVRLGHPPDISAQRPEAGVSAPEACEVHAWSRKSLSSSVLNDPQVRGVADPRRLRDQIAKDQAATVVMRRLLDGGKTQQDIE
jgi:hypothetical protein